MSTSPQEAFVEEASGSTASSQASREQALQVLRTQFRMFGTYVTDNVNAGGSAILIRKNLLPDFADVTHEITCQGRDHIGRIQSSESVLVVINVHFEPDLTFRNLRERLRRIAFHRL